MLPFQQRKPEEVVSSAISRPASYGQSASAGTMKVTASHVRFFCRYLKDICGMSVDESEKWHEMSEAQLLFHFKEFFAGIKNQNNGSDLQPSYLWNIFASLQRELRIKRGRGHLSSNSITEVADVLKAVCEELKAKGEGCLPHAKDELTKEEISTLYDDKVAGIHNPCALLNAMAIVLMFMGVRGDRELYEVCLGDLTLVSFDGVRHLVLDKERITKTTPSSVRSLPKLPELPNLPDRCPVRCFQEMINNRPELFNSETSKLFIRPATKVPKVAWPSTEKWFYNSPMGHREVGKIGLRMVQMSSIDNAGRSISNASFRKLLKSSLQRGGISPKVMENVLDRQAASSIFKHGYTPVNAATKISSGLFSDTNNNPGPYTSTVPEINVPEHSMSCAVTAAVKIEPRDTEQSCNCKESEEPTALATCPASQRALDTGDERSTKRSKLDSIPALNIAIHYHR